MHATVTPDALGELTVLGSGGQGTVYAVSGHLIGGRWPAAYKEFAPSVRDALDVPALLSMIRLREELPAQAVRRLDERTAWPAAVVARDGEVAGFLMRRAPEEFHTEIKLPGGRAWRIAQVQLLLNDERYLTARGLAVDDRFRFDLLHDVAQTIEMLHGLGVVVGDLSPTNLLFSRERRPRCFFLDCDAMRLRGASALDQAETTDWQTPAGGEPIATPATDSYKFALLCVRLFAGDQSVRTPAAMAGTGPALRMLVTRGLSADPRLRPTMSQWRGTLAAAAQRSVSAARRPAVAPPRRKVRRLPVAAAVVAVSLLIMLVFTLRACVDRLQGVGFSFGDDRAAVVEQAGGVARVLAGSAHSRDRLDAAVADVAACADPRGAAATLRSVAGERRTQAERTAGLHVDMLPRGAELRARMGSALEHARQAAQSYAAWATDVAREGCGVRGADQRRGDAASRQAEAAWARVALLYNGIADEHGHPRVSAQDL